MKVLVVGGAGYLGCVLVPFLLKKNFKVNILDLFLYGDNLSPHANLKKIKGDVRNIDIVKQSLQDCEIVIHLACISNDPSFELNPKLGKSINLDSFRPFVEMSKKLNIKKFIYASSSSVYGLKNTKNVDEDSLLEPLTDYSKFKAECEKILNEYKSKDFCVTSVRSATICGFSKRQRFDLIVNIFVNQAFNTKKIKIFGGDQLRPNIHICDISDFYVLLATLKNNEMINGQAFNVGYENYSISKIADLVQNEFDNSLDISSIATNDNRSYHISSKKVFDILGFRAIRDISQAIKDLKIALENKQLHNSMNNEMYFNIQRMRSLNLK
jgi:nucleoside-diphosphate-sugar epimerase